MAFAAPAGWSPGEFPLATWWGPPDGQISVERYKAIAAAGMTYVLPAGDGRNDREVNRKILDTAQAAGLRAFLKDPRMPPAITGVPDARQRLDAIVADYAGHPALAGYYLIDEPGATAFAGLGEVAEYLRSKDPAHPAYVNLYPDYASQQQLGTTTYLEYVERYVETVRPFAISYDHYHFLKSGDRPGFFGNLELIRRAALKYDRPFWNIVLAIEHDAYRFLTEAEKRWEAMQTLAYGGKGLLYFTFWDRHDEFKRINADVRALGRHLLPAKSIAVFQHGNIAPGGTRRRVGTPVQFAAGGDITVGVFKDGPRSLVLFANRDYRQPTAAEAELLVGASRVERLNKGTNRWEAVSVVPTGAGSRVRLELAPGDADLYRW